MRNIVKMESISTRTRARARSSVNNQDPQPILLRGDNVSERKESTAKKRKRSKSKQAAKNENEEAQKKPLPLPKMSAESEPYSSKLTPKSSLPDIDVNETDDHDVDGSSENKEELSKSENSSSLKPESENKIDASKVDSHDSVSDKSMQENTESVSHVNDETTVKSNSEFAGEKNQKKPKAAKRLDDVIDFTKVNEKEQAKEVYGIFKSESFRNAKPKGRPVSGRVWKTEHTSRYF